MPVSSFVDSRPGTVRRPRFIPSRPIDLTPLKYGEKPFETLVNRAFDGPVLRLSRRMQLLEEADNRGIRRGDAIDLIELTQRRLESTHAVSKPPRIRTWLLRFGGFVVVYAVASLAWCLLLAA